MLASGFEMATLQLDDIGVLEVLTGDGCTSKIKQRKWKANPLEIVNLLTEQYIISSSDTRIFQAIAKKGQKC